MVVSSPTYHIVGKVPLGHIQLGTLIDDLGDIVPLNPNEELNLGQDRLYCEHETTFTASREDMLKGNCGVGLKVLAMQAAEASAGGERGDHDTYKFGSLDTLFFYPTKADYQEAVKSKGLTEYLEGSGYSPVYLITGIKTGRRPAVDLQRTRKVNAALDVSIDTGTGISVGPKLDASKSVVLKQGSEESTDYIWAVRVQKLSYRKKWKIFGEREWANRPHLDGAELVGVESAETVSEVEEWYEVEEMALEDETKGYVEMTELNQDGEVVTWIVPN